MRWIQKATGLLALSLLRPAAAAAAPADFLTDARVDISAARYFPGERDLHWTAWIGGGLGLLRIGKVTFYGTADVETLIGGAFRTFDANQANYHLELGTRVRLGALTATPFFHHVSRHYIDRSKRQSADWNLLGLRLERDAELSGRSVHFLVSLGHTTQASLPKYGWEAVGELDAQVLRFGQGSAFFRARERFVSAEPTLDLPRGDFLDSLVEAGARYERDGHGAEFFVAFERRNDVYVELPGVRDRALVGIRFLYGTPATRRAP